jgi:hypothetical protein
MTAEIVVCPDCGEDQSNVQQVEFCDPHQSVVRALMIERGFGADCELTDDERRDLIIAGDMDAYTEVMHTLFVGVLSIFGGPALSMHNGCPACVLEGTVVRAADEVASSRRKSN